MSISAFVECRVMTIAVDFNRWCLSTRGDRICFWLRTGNSRLIFFITRQASVHKSGTTLRSHTVRWWTVSSVNCIGACRARPVILRNVGCSRVQKSYPTIQSFIFSWMLLKTNIILPRDLKFNFANIFNSVLIIYSRKNQEKSKDNPYYTENFFKESGSAVKKKQLKNTSQ